ncbi:MAG: hypothetical protein KGZ74_05455 [Chitinophagaceae bacterium]|nr:hypothetical protein [Chitinophagaceae bacterium]
MNKFFILLVFAIIQSVGINAQVKRTPRQGANPSADKKNANVYNYTLEQFKGKWQEVIRLNHDKSENAVTDTIFLYFKDENKVETRDGRKTYMKGEALIEEPGNILVAAADIYKIISVKSDTIVLDDQDEFIHVLVKVEQFWLETVGKNTVTTEVYDKPMILNLNDVQGSWFVYRRQAKPGAIDANAFLIKQIKITSVTDSVTASGEIAYYKGDLSETIPCTISVKGEEFTIISNVFTWKLAAYKAANKEWVFGEKEKLLYFAKPL